MATVDQYGVRIDAQAVRGAAAMFDIAKDEAARVALMSLDADTHVGAVIFDKFSIKAAACNNLTPGVAPAEERCTRPHKYQWMAHAEQSAIAACARQGQCTADCFMFCTHFPCAPCAASIVLAGIRVVYVSAPEQEPEQEVGRETQSEDSPDSPDGQKKHSWAASHRVAGEILRKGGVHVYVHARAHSQELDAAVRASLKKKTTSLDNI